MHLYLLISNTNNNKVNAIFLVGNKITSSFNIIIKNTNIYI